MDRDIWGVFHDGDLKDLKGTVPGAVHLRVEIEYLRQMFAEPGDSFFVELLGCTRVRFTPYGEQPIEDLDAIGSLSPEVLYVTSTEPLVLDCAEGNLELEYEVMRITLPSGDEVSYEALAAACKKYWDDWSARSGGNA